MAKIQVKVGSSSEQEVSKAVEELQKQLVQEDTTLLLFFASPQYDPHRLAEAFKEGFPNTTLMGCSTAGEITPTGFKQGSVTAMSIASPKIRVAPVVIQDILNFKAKEAKSAVEQACNILGVTVDNLKKDRHFGMTLIDGLSAKEEVIIASLSMAAPALRIFGGSAADGFSFQKTYLSLNGKVYERSAIFALFESDIPFKIIKTEHLVSTGKKMVITKADASTRKVIKINGKPARQEYAHLVGVPEEKLSIEIAQYHPFGFYVGEEPYVRSISQILEDGSLQFACAIEEGAVVTLMKEGNMIEDTHQAMEQIKQELKEISGIIILNCLGRYVASEATGVTEAIFKEYNIGPIVGFNTYGEQYGSLHINHTCTGLALGQDA